MRLSNWERLSLENWEPVSTRPPYSFFNLFSVSGEAGTASIPTVIVSGDTAGAGVGSWNRSRGSWCKSHGSWSNSRGSWCKSLGSWLVPCKSHGSCSKSRGGWSRCWLVPQHAQDSTSRIVIRPGRLGQLGVELHRSLPSKWHLPLCLSALVQPFGPLEQLAP